MKAVGISGSLRRGSYNSALLRAAAELVPEGMTIERFDLSAIPLYNGDVEALGLPESVVELRQKIAAADGLLIATPEYNYSIPGVLKNAIDWESRPPNQPLKGKPAAIMGASIGYYGTVRAQAHLRQVLQAVGCLVMPQPELMLARAEVKFDPDGRLSDEKALEHLKRFVEAFLEWASMMRK